MVVTPTGILRFEEHVSVAIGVSVWRQTDKPSRFIVGLALELRRKAYPLLRDMTIEEVTGEAAPEWTAEEILNHAG